jgi:hypothetical protein
VRTLPCQEPLALLGELFYLSQHALRHARLPSDNVA